MSGGDKLPLFFLNLFLNKEESTEQDRTHQAKFSSSVLIAGTICS